MRSAFRYPLAIEAEEFFDVAIGPGAQGRGGREARRGRHPDISKLREVKLSEPSFKNLEELLSLNQLKSLMLDVGR